MNVRKAEDEKGREDGMTKRSFLCTDKNGQKGGLIAEKADNIFLFIQ